MTTYRVGNHQPRNLYRGDQYIGVCFDPADTALIVDALEGRTPVGERWAEVISHGDAQVSAALSLRTPDLAPGVPASTPDVPKAAEISSAGWKTVHLIRQDYGTTGCCYRTPTELPRDEHLTLNPDTVTCGLVRRADEHTEECR